MSSRLLRPIGIRRSIGSVAAVLLLAALVPLAALIGPGTAVAVTDSGFFDCTPGAASPVNCPATSAVASTSGSFAGTDDSTSVFVGGDMEVTGSANAAEGRVVVMGDFSLNKTGGTSDYQIGEVATGSRITPTVDTTFLHVGGQLSVAAGQSLTVGLNRQGSVRHAGAASGSVQAGGAVSQDARAVAAYVDATVSLTTLSECLASSATTGTHSGSQANVLFTGDNSSQIQVFDFDGSIGGSDNGVFEFENIPAGATVIVNMTNPTWVNFNTSVGASGGSVGSGVMREKLLFNISEAATVRLGGRPRFQGSMLVGNPASVTTNKWSTLEGRLYTAGDLIHSGSLSQSIHNYPFTGALPSSCSSPTLPLPGSVTIVKQTVPPASQDFTFTATGLGPGSFTLAGNGAGASSQRTFDDLVAGTYTVSETAVPGYSVSISCDDSDSTSSDSTATIAVAAGESVTCTFTNTALPPASLGIQMSINGEAADSPADAIQVAAGSTVISSYEVSHTGEATSGDITDIVVTDTVADAGDCDDDNQDGVSSGCALGALAVLCPETSLSPGESMTCATHSSLADEGSYVGSATVSGVDVTGATVEATDLSHYLGIIFYNYDLATTIKFASASPPVPVQTGDVVTYEVEVFNQGSLGSGAFEAIVAMSESMSYVSDTADVAVVVSDLGDGRVAIDVPSASELASQGSLVFDLVLQIDDPTQDRYRVDIEITADSGDDIDSDPTTLDSNTSAPGWGQADPDTNHNNAATNVDGPGGFFDDHDAEEFSNSEDPTAEEAEAAGDDDEVTEADETAGDATGGDEVLGRVKLAFTGVSSAELSLLAMLLIGSGLALTRIERRLTTKD